MSHILPKPAVKLDVHLSTARVPDSLPETYSTTFTKRTTAEATLKVDDASIRAQAPEFDGQERPFLMIPAEHEGQVTWYRHELRYRGPGVVGLWSTGGLTAAFEKQARERRDDSFPRRPLGLKPVTA